MVLSISQRKAKSRKSKSDAGLIRYHMKETWIKKEHKNSLDLAISKAVNEVLNKPV